MIVNKQLLMQHKACKEGIVFFENNFPDEVDLDDVEIKGDYNGFIYWLGKLPKLIYDHKGDLVEVKWATSQTTHEYDDNHNRIKSILSNGSEYLFKYDDKGNQIESKLNNMFIHRYEYDDRKNRVKSILFNGTTFLFEYDDENRLVTKTVLGDGITDCVYQYEYDIHDNNVKTWEDGVLLVQTSFDDKHNPVEIRIHEETKILYEFKHDSQDRLTEVTENGRIILSIKWLI
jgi:YD repeat-containing protein